MAEPQHLRAVLLNCTLKKTPAVSDTEALMGNEEEHQLLHIG